MIVVDTSALVAIALKEPPAHTCMQAMIQVNRLLMSAGTLAEWLILASRRNFSDAVKRLMLELDIEVIPVTEATAYTVEHSYQAWGKSVHPAGLNYGDCFAYALAQEKNCPLLYVGNDFSQTDVLSALTQD